MLERFQAKWNPVRVKKTRQIKNLEPRFDSIEAEKALDDRCPGINPPFVFPATHRAGAAGTGDAAAVRGNRLGTAIVGESG
jgi:hypothetical protein